MKNQIEKETNSLLEKIPPQQLNIQKPQINYKKGEVTINYEIEKFSKVIIKAFLITNHN